MVEGAALVRHAKTWVKTKIDLRQHNATLRSLIIWQSVPCQGGFIRRSNSAVEPMVSSTILLREQ